MVVSLFRLRASTHPCYLWLSAKGQGPRNRKSPPGLPAHRGATHRAGPQTPQLHSPGSAEPAASLRP